MKKQNLIVLGVMILLATQVAAQEKTAQEKNAPAVDPALCQLLVKHVPAADVTYQPGYDLNGKPVVPADVTRSASIDLHKIQIPLTVNLARIYRIDTTQYPLRSYPHMPDQIGTLVVEDGHVLLNDIALTDQEQDNLSVLCLKQK